MLNNIEKIKIYRAIINGMKEEEPFNKKKNVISAKKLLELSYKRFSEMIKVLGPFKDALQKELDITNIYFAKDMKGETSIVIEYLDNDIKKFFSISEYDENDIEFILDIYTGDFKGLLEENKNKIKDAFKENNRYSFEQKMSIPSVSKLFIINEGCNYFNLNDKQNSLLRLSYTYQDVNGKKILVPNGRQSSLNGVNDLLQNDVNVSNLLGNIKIYEENVPKYLIKKR